MAVSLLSGVSERFSLRSNGRGVAIMPRPTILFRASDFAANAKIPPNATFARASTAYMMGPAGKFISVAAGVPRYPYPPGGGPHPRGYLPEPQRVNLIAAGAHNAFNNAAWNLPVGWTRTAVTDTTSPFSGDPWEIVDNTAGSDYLFITTTIAADALWRVCSFFVKPMSGLTAVQVFGNAIGGAGFVLLATYTLTGAGSVSVGGTGGSPIARITPYPGGWYLIELAFLNDGAITSFTYGIHAGTGDASTGTFRLAWSQFEEGPDAAGARRATSPIEAQSTRNADTLYMTVAATPPFTGYVRWNALNTQYSLSYPFALNNGAIDNVVNMQVLDSPLNEDLGVHVFNGGVQTVTPQDVGDWTGAGRLGIVGRIAAANYLFFGTGGSYTQASGVAPGAMNRLDIGYLSLLSNGWVIEPIEEIGIIPGIWSANDMRAMIV